MARKIQHKRGPEKDLPRLEIAEWALTTDTEKPFIGAASGNVEIAKKKDLEAVSSEVSKKADATEVTALGSQLADTAATAKRTKQRDFFLFQERNNANLYGNTYSVLGDRSFIFKIGLGENETFDLEFRKDALDDLIKFRTGVLNTSGETTVREDFLDASVSGGTISASSTESPYATTVGTTITHEFEGPSLYFHHFMDGRGGVWEFAIDGNVIGEFSTHWNAVTPEETLQTYIARRLITDSLAPGSHTVVMTFKGDDPNNPPTGGAGTSRGWLRRNTGSSSNPDYNLETFEFIADASISVEAISDSNKSFAFSAKEVGATYSAQWFPEHNSIGTAFVGDSGFQEVYVDGKLISKSQKVTDQPFKEVKMVQKLEYIHPDAPDPLGVLLMTTTINHKGVSYANKMTWLKDVEINSGYVNMFTINSDFGKELVSSMGGKYDLTLTDGSIEYLSEPAPTGFVAINAEKYPNYYVYLQSFTPDETLRLDKEGRYGEVDGKNFYYLQHRNARLQKLYPVVYSGHTAQAGEVYQFEGHYGIGKHPRVAELFS